MARRHPYLLGLDGPKSDLGAFGVGAALRLHPPFGTRAYRLFWESYFGAIRGDEAKFADGVDVNTYLRYQAASLPGAEFQVGKLLTWALALGGATADDGLAAAHPRLDSENFAAQTTLRWYFQASLDPHACSRSASLPLNEALIMGYRSRQRLVFEGSESSEPSLQ